jgi:hypothetical protein
MLLAGIYDNFSKRFYVVVARRTIPGPPSTSPYYVADVFLAVSRTSDPAGLWSINRIDA